MRLFVKFFDRLSVCGFSAPGPFSGLTL